MCLKGCMNLFVERLPGKFWERECGRSFCFVVSPSPFPVYQHHAFCDFGWVWWMSIHVQVVHIKGRELGRHGRWFWLGAKVVVMWGRGEEGLGIIGLGVSFCDLKCLFLLLYRGSNYLLCYIFLFHSHPHRRLIHLHLLTYLLT